MSFEREIEKVKSLVHDKNDRETAHQAVIEKWEQREYETLTGLLEMLEEGPVC